jgi:predicted nucleotidyltransferase
LEAILGCRVDVVSARGLRDRFRDRVLADAVVL